MHFLFFSFSAHTVKKKKRYTSFKKKKSFEIGHLLKQ